MSEFRKKPIVITAERWFKNGDHPLDYSSEAYDHNDFPQTQPVDKREGALVRYFRHPEVKGEKLCIHCGRPMNAHGWIDTLEAGHRVCPGDWIIKGVKGEFYPCKHDIFKETYEPVDDGPMEAPIGKETTLAMGIDVARKNND